MSVSEKPPQSAEQVVGATPALSKVCGLGEVPGLDLQLSGRPRSVAWVQTVADVEGVMEQVQAMGFELIEPYEFMSREAGKPGIETGIVDWDGHLVMFYGLKRP